MSASQPLQPAQLDLWGSRLIEASAGTGKTWTIAALYLRLVLGHGGAHAFTRALRPSEILVMTFTRASTRELSDRIRARLLQAARCFRGDTEENYDVFLTTLLADYPPGEARTHAAWLLDIAAQSMDEAAIFTIDAWCQRMLREHAFDSGSLFDETLVADEVALRTEAAHDYWRQSCYPLPEAELTQVLTVWRDVDALVADMRDLLPQATPNADTAQTLAQVLAAAVAARAQALEQLRQGWTERAQAMLDWVEGQLDNHAGHWNQQRLNRNRCRGWLATLAAWANGTLAVDVPDLKKGWERFTLDGLLAARHVAAPPFELPTEFAEFATLRAACDALPKVAVPLRLHATRWVRARVLQGKRASGSFGFADMQERLHDALHSADSAHPGRAQRLRARMLQQYPVALIDEFQDTSPLQYQIFDQLYQVERNDPSSAVLLIGDPKQSIYGFRGADIHSYLQARRATAGRHYALQTNFRSTPALVDAVNRCFSRAESQHAAGAFGYRTTHDDPLPFTEVQAKTPEIQWVQGGTPLPALTLVHELELHNASDMRQRFSERCATQIVAWLNAADTGFVSLGATGEEAFRRLRAADIAILVRTGSEASAVRQALERRGVASVYLSDRDSVFESQEAADLVHWLRAVANPQDVRLVRAGLATATLGLSLDALAWLAHDDEAFDQRSEQLRQLRSVWRTQGVLAMLRQTLHQLELTARWRAAPNGERRLTNFLHLAELLQTASVDLDGEHALVRWLLAQREGSSREGDAHVLRLESDADLVKVVTIHKSKGLQYPVVCLPFATSFRAKERKSTGFVDVQDADGTRELLLQYSDAQLARADTDRLREDLRLLYVALTRAQHSVWLGFSALKRGATESCTTHRSALGYLLAGDGAGEASDWREVLERLAQDCPGMALQAALGGNSRTLLEQSAPLAPLRDAMSYSGRFERDWTVGSFSRMAKNLGDSAPSPLSPIQQIRPADDEGEGTEPEPRTLLLAGPRPEAQTHFIAHSFVRGAKTGNFLHAQLEWLAAEQFALADQPALQERLRKRCERAGFASQAEALVAWFTELVSNPLPGPGAALCQLDTTLAEMEFWLVAQRMDSGRIDALCRQHLLPGVARPALAQQQLQGMLMGFADLVFEHQGRYWVLDYKSNHLGPDDAAYSKEALQESMAEHRYDVQASLYLLALHRLLQARLGADYDPLHHLGGAVYLYLRGIRGPERGVCLVAPDITLLDALEDMLAPMPDAA
jgi:exodeoxyribonuclease V beta subunit